MQASELRQKSLEELAELGGELRKELFDLRFKHYTGQLVNTAELRVTRRGIARVETIIRERALVQTASES